MEGSNPLKRKSTAEIELRVRVMWRRKRRRDCGFFLFILGERKRDGTEEGCLSWRRNGKEQFGREGEKEMSAVTERGNRFFGQCLRIHGTVLSPVRLE